MLGRLARSRVATAALAVAVAGGVARAGERPALTGSQKLSVYSKPSVVRVYGAYVGKFTFNGKTFQMSVGGTGSGFFLAPDGYIATNAHVVSDIHDGDTKAKDALTKRAIAEVIQTYRKELERMPEAQALRVLQGIQLVELRKLAFVVLPNGEQANYDIKAYGAPIGEGKDVAIIKVHAENAPTLTIGDSTKVQVQEHLLAIGYPGAADLTGLLDKASQLEASITDGTVSAIKRTQEGDQVIQITAPITHGNSGGPAINDKGEVVGLTTFASAKEVQGFNFLVSSQTVMEFVRQAGAKNEPSVANAMWVEALELFWDDDFSDAIKKMEELLQVYPAHSEAPGFIKQARTAIREGKERKKPGNAGLVVGLVIGGLVLAALALVAVRRSKRAPAAGAPMMPGPAPMMPGGPAMPGVMAGSVAAHPIAKTMAVGRAAPPPGQVAPTAFGSLTLGTLTCTRGQLTGQRFSLTPTGVIIGRQPGVAHVLVNDHRASGKHVWIGFDNGKLVAIDQGTTNGTFVNDVSRGRISRAELRDGDVVIVGEPDCCSLQVKVG